MKNKASILYGSQFQYIHIQYGQVPLAQLTHLFGSSLSGYRSQWKTCDRSRAAKMKSVHSSATAVKK